MHVNLVPLLSILSQFSSLNLLYIYTLKNLINVANRTQVKVIMESVKTLPKSCEKFRDNLAKEITKAPNPTRSSKHIFQKS